MSSKVKTLINKDDKRAFLESINKDHIDLRLKETNVWNKYGRHSKEYKKIVEEHRVRDIILAEKISLYLDNYGYPSIMQLGYRAAIIPIAHITHTNDRDLLEENFDYFYDAYLFNDITEDLFYEYLVKLLKIKRKESWDLTRKHNTNKAIDILLEKVKILFNESVEI